MTCEARLPGAVLMTLDRRTLLAAGAGFGAGLGALAVTTASAGPRLDVVKSAHNIVPDLSLDGADGNHTAAIQSAIDAAAQNGTPVLIPPGVYRVGTLTLRDGTRLSGTAGLTTLEFTGGAAVLTAKGANALHIENLILDGMLIAPAAGENAALFDLQNCGNIYLSRLVVRQSLVNGISLTGCSGRVTDCIVHNALLTGIFSLDATGLEISHNTVRDCGNNGIQVWRSKPGEDGTLVTVNRVTRISTKGGGTGQNGNGINVFRAGSVMVSNNRISDCAFSAIRGNAASNIQMLGNSCERLGEVALYAEFGFQGAVIANNLVDTAATGISVTNFNEGGRLAVIQGNLIRNLFRRESDPTDKRGEGIGVEADSIVSGNVIENAPTCGILIGWGQHMRNCMVTQNLVRDAKTGILITSDARAGTCMISGNMFSGMTDGAIRAMEHGAPFGPDLAIEKIDNARVAISGNVVG
jgi:uncharacterized secreted repeat protein (TIGR03808 family)